MPVRRESQNKSHTYTISKWIPDLTHTPTHFIKNLDLQLWIMLRTHEKNKNKIVLKIKERRFFADLTWISIPNLNAANSSHHVHFICICQHRSDHQGTQSSMDDHLIFRISKFTTTQLHTPFSCPGTWCFKCQEIVPYWQFTNEAMKYTCFWCIPNIQEEP